MNIQKAKAFIQSLADNGCLWHFDDDPVDCLSRVATKSLAAHYGEMINKIYAANLDWGKYGCPIGYSIKCHNETEASK